MFCMVSSLRLSLVQDAPFFVVLTFTFQMASRGMLIMFTLMLALSSRLAMLFCFCKCIPFL